MNRSAANPLQSAANGKNARCIGAANPLQTRCESAAPQRKNQRKRAWRARLCVRLRVARAVPNFTMRNEKMSEYTIKAHPTEYRGTMFRSRLEATWAAYFDLAGVVWEYEPFDLEGWSPDLLLRVNGVELLAEIKPVLETGSEMPVFAKAAKFGKQHWILLLGRAPLWYTIGCLCDQPPGEGRGDIWLEVHEKLHPANAKSLWAAATNTTRWRASR